MPRHDAVMHRFFVAPHRDALMRAWLDEYRSAWAMGPERWIEENVRHRDWRDDEHWSYLVQHACFRVVLEDRCVYT